MSRYSDPVAGTVPDSLRVGECSVDVPLREILAPGVRRAMRVTPKAMAVLLVLVENAGRVVTRDTLIARVWPDTLPTDDVLTQAITQLRKAFGEKRGSTRYIETIAKSGYRLLAPVEGMPDDAAAFGKTPASEGQEANASPVETSTGDRPAPAAGSGNSHAPVLPVAAPGSVAAARHSMPWRSPVLWFAALALLLWTLLFSCPRKSTRIGPGAAWATKAMARARKYWRSVLIGKVLLNEKRKLRGLLDWRSDSFCRKSAMAPARNCNSEGAK